MAFTGRPGPVVVGVDYSAGGAAALSYAAWEAQRRGAGLKLIHGFVATDPGEALPTAPYDDNELVVAAEERLAEAAVAHLSPGFPRSLVTTKVVAGSGGSALVDESLRAGLVVVGARGLGGFDGLLLGSVAVQVSKHSRCPVVVVRSSAGRMRRRTEAGSGRRRRLASSTEALSFGFDEAAARGARLVAVHVWSVPALAARTTGTVWSPRARSARAQLEEAADRVLDDALKGWEQKYPQVDVVRWSRHGDEPARALLASAEDIGAELVVVGSRPRDRTGTVLGSVSQALVSMPGYRCQ